MEPPAPEPAVLRRFFAASSLGLTEPSVTLASFALLQSRLPARGRPRYANARAVQLHATFARAGVVPPTHEARAATRLTAPNAHGALTLALASLKAEETLLLQRRAVDDARRHQCAALVQSHALRWLYKPGGPMVRAAMRELACVCES